MSERVVQCSCLGSMGRFGNQLFQYAFARAYAEANDARLETPDWVGRRIFKGVDRDPIISSPLPRLDVDEMPAPGQVNIDLHGFFQGKRWLDWYSREWARDVFTLTDELTTRIAPWSDLTHTPPYGAAHVRRGDYQEHLDAFCIVSTSSYAKSIVEVTEPFTHWPIWVSEEHPHWPELLSPEMSFLYDFLILRGAKTLWRGASTFSWWAATLGYGDVYSPDIQPDDIGHRDVSFVPGNTCRTFAAGEALPIRERQSDPVVTDDSSRDDDSHRVATLLKGVGR